MKRWVKRLLWVVAVVIVVLLGAGLVLRSMISGSLGNELATRLSTATGVQVTIGTARLDLARWMRLEPAISLEGVAIGNPPGFRGAHLLEAEGMAARVALAPLMRRKLEVQSVVIDRPKIMVETNQAGTTNVEAFLRRLSPPSKSAPAAGDPPASVSVGELNVNSGEIIYSGAAQAPALSVSNIGIRVRDFAPGAACHFDASATLFGGKRSGFKAEGTAGPFAPDALPLSGSLSVQLAPSEVPARIRAEQFGDLLKSPGANSTLNLDAKLEGDLYGTVSGPAKLVISGLMIGRDEQHLLKLAGDVPARFAASKLMSSPAFGLKVARADARLGSGEWRGDAEVRMHGALTSGSSAGSIRNVDINDLLTNFTTASGKIYGLAEIPAYRIAFSGRNADEIKRSLEGAGKLSITKGRLAALDLLASIEKGLSGSGGGAAAAQGATPFSTLLADIAISKGQMEFSTISLDGPVLGAKGKGAIGFDQSMHFDLNTRVTGGVARLVNKLSRQPDSNEAYLPVVVAGAVGSPQVRPNVRQFATGAVQGLIESFFGKKKQ